MHSNAFRSCTPACSGTAPHSLFRSCENYENFRVLDFLPNLELFSSQLLKFRFQSSQIVVSMLEDESKNKDIDELPILSSLERATQISTMFLTIFLEKISSRKEDIDFRTLFENFIQDLLSTVNKPFIILE